jgi:hypothetical protein
VVVVFVVRQVSVKVMAVVIDIHSGPIHLAAGIPRSVPVAA